jgi:hypothetical protein
VFFEQRPGTVKAEKHPDNHSEISQKPSGQRNSSLVRVPMRDCSSERNRKYSLLVPYCHGREFQDVVFEFTHREAERSGNLATCTGNTTGAIKHCKIGDAVLELGPECAAAGERFVIEAKEDASYDLKKAQIELESTRKNRQASVGVFIFSAKTASAGQEPFLR